ncbi:hypothetical protein ACFQ0M_25950 [Kitasatospora aburaviensis]
MWTDTRPAAEMPRLFERGGDLISFAGACPTWTSSRWRRSPVSSPASSASAGSSPSSTRPRTWPRPSSRPSPT